MRINLRSLFLGSVSLIAGCTDAGVEPAAQATAEAAQPITSAARLGVTPLALDATGTPRLLRGSATTPKQPAATATESARKHLAALAPTWGVRSAKVPAVDAIGEVKLAGGTLVRFAQKLDGLPIHRSAGEVRVMVRPDGSLIGASGKLLATDTPRAAATFVDDEAGAVARAVNDKYNTKVAAARLGSSSATADGAKLISGADAGVTVSMSRARKMWYPAGGSLVQAWVVEAYASNGNTTDSDAFRTVIGASGKIIARHDLKADVAFKYRVFGETTGEFHPFDGPTTDVSPLSAPVVNGTPFPAFVAPNLLSIVGTNHPTQNPDGVTGPDPWLYSSAAETKGNNVDAYTDINAPDGLSNGDFRAELTAARTFDYTYDTAKDATADVDQQMAGITSLFYILNWMHDFWYDGGFTEAAGNGQNSNYGRGGEERDAMLGEAQDNANGGSRNNANMSTPEDGMPGRMQVFVWDNLDHRKLTVEGVDVATGSAAFAQHFNITAPVVVASDGGTTTACTAAPAGTYTGKIVLVDRGTCNFKLKALNVQAGDALGIIIADNIDEPLLNLADTAGTPPVTIGVVSVTKGDGASIKAKIAAGTTNATMVRNLEADLDGSLDASVLAHEFGHFVHHRLSSCNTSLCGAMSEGWADFSSLLVVSRAGDNLDGGYSTGVYSTRGISTDPVYYGIRRAPYSVNHDLDPRSFRHMAAGEALPPAPFEGGNPSNNSEVHNAGEIWTSMLWEGYVALQKAGTDFDAVRLKMRQYVVAGLLLAPVDATPTETRDALLTAVKAASPEDYEILVEAYARRGFGSCAESPDRDSSSFVGIVESNEVKGRAVAGEVTLGRSTSCDNDQVLDGGESLIIRLPVLNSGPRTLHGAKATLTSAIPELKIDTATIQLGDIEPDGSATASFSASLADTVTGPIESDLVITIESDDGCSTLEVPVLTAFNTDDKLEASATDSFDANATAWTFTHTEQNASDTSELWSHERDSGTEGYLFGQDAGHPSDGRATSPKIIAGDAPVSISFKHVFLFESDGATTAYDGGVIEYSTDGETWADISEIADPGYNWTLDGDPQETGNPLSGRDGFSDVNDSFPDVDEVTLDIGTALAGKTFQIRFRVGSDANTGGGGWIVDDFAVTGATNAPFPTLVADAGTCTSTNPPTNGDDDDDGGCRATGGIATGNLAVLGVLGAVLLRRRRRAAKA